MKRHFLDVGEKGWYEPFRVEFIEFENRQATLISVEPFIEDFQIYGENIKSKIACKPEELSRFLDRINDWLNCQQYLEMNEQSKRRRLYSCEPDDAA